MTLEILQKEMITAMKAKDKIRKDTISSLYSAVKKAAIDKKCKDNITEALVNEVLIKEQKTMQEMIDTCPAERIETLEMYHEQMKIIKEFALQLITSKSTIKRIVYQILAKNNIEIVPKNKGLIMKTVMPVLKGKVDMGTAQNVISSMITANETETIVNGQ